MPEKTKPQSLEVRIKGRLEGHAQIQSQNGVFFSNQVTVPAEDEFSYPQKFQVNGPAPLGADGDMVDVICNIRPINRKKEGIMYYNIQLWKQ